MANEKRLIDLDANLKRLEKESWWLDEAKSCIRMFLAKAKVVDAVEVVHGRWESTRFGDIRIATCSACGAKQGLYINGRVPNLNYCPNCGAKMDDMRCVP